MKNLQFGQWLKGLRVAAGLTQKEVADICQCSHTYISKIEAGKTDYMPSEEQLICFSAVLKVGAEEMIFRSGKIPSAYSELLSRLAIRYGEKLPSKLEALLDD